MLSGGTDFWAGIIDIPFGLVLLACALWLRTRPGVSRYWVLTCGFGAASAGMGVLHHLLLQHPRWLAEASWIVTAVLLVLALSCMLAASALDVVGPRATRLVLAASAVGLVAYIVTASLGSIGTVALVACEALTMLGVVGLWCYAAGRGHPRAAAMLLGIGVSALSTVLFLVPDEVLAPLEVTAGSLSHLVQIPGFILITRAAGKAVSRPRPAPAPR